MGWNFRSNTQSRINAALDFISNGNIANTTNDDVLVFDNGGTYAGCTDSSQCAVGWSCIGGACSPPKTTGSSDGDTNSGSSNTDCPVEPSPVPPPPGSDCGGPGPVGSGSGGSVGGGPCSKPGCGGVASSPGPGGAPTGDDCCGGRCCRISAYGVSCYCGPCPPPGRCQKFCDSYKKSNGRDAEGCGGATTCTECETCKTFDFYTECVPISSGGPCHCGGGNACRGACDRCEEDGTCNTSCANCTTCYTMYNQPCSCGYYTFRCCFSSCNGFANYSECRNAGCGGVCPPDGPALPPGDPIEPCDCNCHLDCPDCFICNSAGECVPDPLCDGCTKKYCYTTTQNQALVASSYSFAGNPPIEDNCKPGQPLNTIVKKVCFNSPQDFDTYTQQTSGFDVPGWCVGPGPYYRTATCVGTCISGVNTIWDGQQCVTASGGGMQNNLYEYSGSIVLSIEYEC